MDNKKKLNPILKIVIYILCIILIASYLVILWMGANPNVGREYRMYYITHQLTDWPGYGGLWYGFNEVEYCIEDTDKEGNKITDRKVCKRKGIGWQTKGRLSGTMSNDRESVVHYVAGINANNPSLRLSIKDYDGKGAVRVYMNENYLGSFKSNGTQIIPMPNIQKDDFFTIKFVSEDTTFNLWAIAINANGN